MTPPALIVIVNVSQIFLLLFVVTVNSNNNKVALTLHNSMAERLRHTADEAEPRKFWNFEVQKRPNH